MQGRGLDKPLLLTVAVLLIAGLATLYSAGQTDVPTGAAGVWRRQLVFVAVGTFATVIAYRVSPRLLEWATPFVYGLAIAGVRIGQPTEFAKLATILMLARHLAGRREGPRNLWELMPACVLAGVPFVLVGLQPDLGSAIVFVGILLVMLFWVGTNPWLLLLLVSPLVSLLMAFSTISWGVWIVVLTLLLIWLRPYVLEGVVVWMINVVMGVLALELWNRLAPYQQNRLLSFLNPEIDPRATGWHIIQSKVAIGSGGLFGKGYIEGTQKRLAFIPEQTTDFIYTVLGEEFGFVGVLASLLLFAVLIVILVRIARRATDAFASLVAFGIAGMFATHVLENVGMTVGLMPITGIPLPFFSYGGSFLLTCFLAVGLALRVAWEARLAGYADV